jgi:hypothetical protein
LDASARPSLGRAVIRPVVVRAHDVARVDDQPPEHNRHVDRPGCALDRALARHVSAPHGEAHRSQLRRVAHTRVDHQPAHAARLQ